MLVVGAVLSATGVGTALGVSLMVAGGSMMASNIMSAAGVDSKLATYISAGLNILAGVALCFTPFAAIGASMIGSCVGSVAGGHISEAIGFSFEVGAMIGGIVGGIAGGQTYKGIQNTRAVNFLKGQGFTAEKAKEITKSFDLAPTFKNVKSGTTINRVWGGKSFEISGFVSPKTFSNPIKSLAIRPEWGNTATNTSKLVIQSNAKVLVGWAARQGSLRGGGLQWFVANLSKLKLA